MNAVFELARALSICVRLMTLDQIARGFTRGDLANARRLVRSPLLESTTVVCRTTPPMDGPLLLWKPGMPDPDYDALAYVVRTRSEQSETHQVTVYTASRKAQQLFGGFGILKRDQAAHDLAVSTVYNWYRINKPELAAVWRGEDVDFSRGKRETHPDAFLPGRIIEICGSYPVSRLRRLIDDARKRNEEIELW